MYMSSGASPWTLRLMAARRRLQASRMAAQAAVFSWFNSSLRHWPGWRRTGARSLLSEGIQDRDPAVYEMPRVSGHKSQLVELGRRCNHHVGRRPGHAASLPVTPQLAGPLRDLGRDRKHRAIGLQEPFEPASDPRVRFPGQPEEDLLDGDGTDRDPSHRPGPLVDTRVRTFPHQLAEDI